MDKRGTTGKAALARITSWVKSALSLKADKSEIPSLSGYATETWVQNQGYQTAAQVQSAIAAAAELPSVTASDNGKFLRVVNAAWAAQAVPAAESASFGGA